MKRINFYLLSILILTAFFISCNSQEGTITETVTDKKTETDTTEFSAYEDNGFPAEGIPEAADVENKFTVVDAFPGFEFSRPLDLQSANDGSGRIFVVEQGGLIWVLSGTGYTTKEIFFRHWWVSR